MTKLRLQASARWILIAVFISGSVCLPGAFERISGPKGRPDSDEKTGLANLRVSELVDKLQEESQQGIGSHATALASGFLAVNAEPKFQSGIIGARKPVSSPVMRELVRRGIVALPELIDHLGDKRPTKLVVEHEHGFGGMWHSDEYQPRYADPKKQPQHVNTRMEIYKGFDEQDRSKSRYTFRVGDVCFVAIGQIVNRRLNASSYHPTACLAINSPVETPALAAAVRQDWAGLTREQHKQSLVQDALRKGSFAREGDALIRLSFYYPEEGERTALKLLARPLYSLYSLWQFIDARLMKERDSVKQKDLIETFRREYDQAAVDALPFHLHQHYWETSALQNESFLAGKQRASRILKEFYPEYDPRAPAFINAAEPYEHLQIIAAIQRNPSWKVEQAIYQLFQSLMQMKADSKDEQFYLDGLSLECINRLVGKGYDQELKDFLEKRFKEIEASSYVPGGQPRLKELTGWRYRLGD